MHRKCPFVSVTTSLVGVLFALPNGSELARAVPRHARGDSPHNNPDRGGGNGVAGTGDDHGISELESKVGNLQTEIESIKKNAPTRWTKIGTICGIVAVIVSVGTATGNLYQWLSKSPHLESVAGHELTLEYRPQKKQVTFQFNVSLANYGQTANVVDSADGQLAMRNNTSGSPLYFSAVDFQCSLARLPPWLPARDWLHRSGSRLVSQG